jgi:hypothetical protein
MSNVAKLEVERALSWVEANIRHSASGLSGNEEKLLALADEVYRLRREVSELTRQQAARPMFVRGVPR